MAAPTKADVLAELKALGVEVSEDTKMPELLEKLREAREAAEAAKGDAAQQGAQDSKSEVKPESNRSKKVHTILTNVLHNGVDYKKGSEVELDKETLAVFLAKGFVAE